MATIKEVKTRISSVKDTKKIANAMYLIASTKMRKAKAELDKSLPHFEASKVEIKRIFRRVKGLQSPYLYPKDMSKFVNGTYGILVITADKGLAGSYNLSVIKETLKLLADHADSKLFVIGEYGRQYFLRHEIPFEEDFRFSAETPTLEEARKISALFLERYQKGELKKIFVVYTNLENRLSSSAISTRLLPFHRDYFDDSKKEKEITREFSFFPSVEGILDIIIRNYIIGFIYGALVDSYCSEQNSRMNAMNAANQNADNLLEDLSLEYNRLRQSSITGEITEISAGAKAQHKNKKKRSQSNESNWNY